jgi:hypothetical protein
VNAIESDGENNIFFATKERLTAVTDPTAEGLRTHFVGSTSNSNLSLVWPELLSYVSYRLPDGTVLGIAGLEPRCAIPKIMTVHRQDCFLGDITSPAVDEVCAGGLGIRPVQHLFLTP